jgi:hypothetical protein
MRQRGAGELNLALGCGFAVALVVAIALIAYLWTL